MIILGTNSIKDTGFDVANSLRFAGASRDTYLKATFGATPTLATKNTISLWFKRSKFDANQQLYTTNNNAANIIFNRSGASTGPTAAFYTNSGQLLGPRLYRDTSAWMHFVFAFDSTQATASNRFKVYINGVEETSFNNTAYPAKDEASQLGVNGQEIQIGTRANYDRIFDGYMAETAFIDGQALDATSFGEFDEDSGIWKPIDVSGLTFGNNGFYLEYKQSGTGTNSSGMGADTSGNNLHFAVTGFTAIDQTTDTCTNNFALANRLNVNAGAVGTFAFGNTTVKVANSSGQVFGSSSTLGMTTGKWYCEVKIITVDSTIAGVSANVSEDARDNVFPGYQDHSVGILFDSGNKYISDSGSTHGDAFSANDILMIALDLDNNNVYFGHNGNWFDGSGNADESNPTSAISITAAASTQDGAYFFSFGDGGGSSKGKVSWNFGNASHAISSGNTDGSGFGNFEYAVPSGYFALCTKNLAEYG